MADDEKQMKRQSSVKSSPPLSEISNPNRGQKAPTGKYKPELGLAKKQQHHDRPEYAELTRAKTKVTREQAGYLSPQEKKRMAKAMVREEMMVEITFG